MLNLASPILSKIFGGVALVLLLAVIIQTVRLNDAKSDIETKRNELATCEAQHAVTRQSVGTLEAVIEDLNERAMARAEAYAQGIEEAEKRSTELAKLSAESDKRIAALRAAAREQVNGDCAVPDSLRALAENL